MATKKNQIPKKKKPHGPDNYKFGTVCVRWRSDRERKAVEAAALKTGFTRSSWVRMVVVEFLGLPDDAS